MKIEADRDSKERVDKRPRRGQPGLDVKVESKVKIEEQDTVATPVEGANVPRETSIASAIKSDEEEVLASDISLKLEPGKPPKIARTSSKKVPVRPPPSYLHLEDATAEARRTFDVLTHCSYANKTLGASEPAWECDCTEEWGMFISSFSCQHKAILTASSRCRNAHQPRLWRRLGLYKSCYSC
jgi:hypothetical protein